MYHCDLHIYLAGGDCPAFDRIRKLPVLPNFTHTFLEATLPDSGIAAGADVVFLNLEGADVGAMLSPLSSIRFKEPQLIALATQDQLAALAPFYPILFDIWPLPMTDGEVDFRLERWQTGCKLRRDHWEVHQYLEATINSSPNMIWYKSKDGIHEKVNDSFCRIVGKSKDVVQGRDHCFIWDVGPEDAKVCAETDQKVMDAGFTITAEESVLSGNERLLLTTYKSPLYDLDGSVMGTVGLGMDITKERAYQEELVRKNHTMETIFTSLNCGIIYHSEDGSQIISINDAALKILGYDSLEDLKASGFDMVAQSVVDEDKPKLRACIQSLTKPGDSADLEYRALHRNGELVHVLGSIKLIEENGERYYQRFLLDITARKLQEEENQRRQMALIQAMGVDYNIVCAFDLKTGLGESLRLELDPGLAERLGLSGELILGEFIERYIHELVYEPDRDLLRRFSSPIRLARALEEKQVCYMDFRIQENGDIKYYEMKAVRTGLWGTQQEIVLGFRSVDETTRGEMKQRQLLEDALAQANQANKAKSTFLSNVSHDIRTPMNAIVGFTSLARTHLADSGKVADYLDKIQASSGHLLRLLNDVLDMSAIESGKLRLSEAPCNLLTLLNELRDLMHADVQAKSLDFQVDYAGITDPGVFCDKLRLDQILLNVLSNAVRYTPSGGSIHLQATQNAGTAAESGTYVFSVTDSGIGMSQEFLLRIFEPFERERNSTTSGIQGTGLGMAITKNLVDMMNGTIRIQSQQGAGTTVTISIPLRFSEEAAVPTEPAVAAAAVRRTGGRILLVEDNLLNQEIAQAILEDAGFIAETAENGRQAVDMLTAHEPGYYKLILMDIQMPVMNGYEATQAIRLLDDPGLSSIPILAMTANAFEEDKRRVLRCGMDGHIAKPVDIDRLLEAIDEFIR